MWVTITSPPAIPLLSLSQCLHRGSPGEPSSLLIRSSAVQVPAKLETRHAGERGELRFWERDDQSTPPLQLGCS